MKLESHKYLDERGIKYKKLVFPKETEKGAGNVAKALGYEEDQMVKTLIFKTEQGELIMILAPGSKNAVSSKLKKAIGSKNIELASPKEIEALTGYKIGSIPPFSWQKKGFRSFIDESLMAFETLGVGAGVWGHEIMITPKDLVTATSAEIVELTKVKAIEENKEDIEINSLSEEFDLQDTKIVPKITSIKDISTNVGKEITVAGWVYNKRSSGKIKFLQIRDGSGFTQGIVEEAKVGTDIWEKANKITDESSCYISGTITKHPSKEEYEIQIKEIKLIQIAPEYPISKKEHGVEFLFDNRDLYLRAKTPWAVLRIRNQVFLSITNFFAERDFIRFDSPIFQPTSCEDTTQLFGLDYFGEKMYLTQSGQLYLEAGIMGLGKVYDFGPVFRAEKSKTRNHLSEFWMMDAEMAFYDQKMNIDLQEAMVKRILSDALKNCKTELEILGRNTEILEKCAEKPFIRMKHFEAKKELKEDGFEVNFEDDMTTEEEIYLGNKYNLPIFIEDYPLEVKSFYMLSYKDERNLERAVCSDLIAPEEAREIIGGSQREHDFNKLLSELKKRNYRMDDYEWYLNVRKYGSVPHSGFGLGLERMVRWISGVHHIRETIPFPRTLVRTRP